MELTIGMSKPEMKMKIVERCKIYITEKFADDFKKGTLIFYDDGGRWTIHKNCFLDDKFRDYSVHYGAVLNDNIIECHIFINHSHNTPLELSNNGKIRYTKSPPERMLKICKENYILV